LLDDTDSHLESLLAFHDVFEVTSTAIDSSEAVRFHVVVDNTSSGAIGTDVELSEVKPKPFQSITRTIAKTNDNEVTIAKPTIKGFLNEIFLLSLSSLPYVVFLFDLLFLPKKSFLCDAVLLLDLLSLFNTKVRLGALALLNTELLLVAPAPLYTCFLLCAGFLFKKPL